MKEIVPSDSRYIPFAQQRSCCVPTSILIVMYKLGIPLVPQELLGYHLGLILDEERAKNFWNPRVGEKPAAGFGTRIHDERYKPNKAFEKLGIPLEMIIHPVEKFKNKRELIDFTQEFINQDRDFLACFNHGVLKKDGTSNGHTCVVDRIYPEKNIIRLIDPSPNQPKWREIDIDLFIEALKNHPIKKGGFWELRKLEK